MPSLSIQRSLLALVLCGVTSACGDSEPAAPEPFVAADAAVTPGDAGLTPFPPYDASSAEAGAQVDAGLADAQADGDAKVGDAGSDAGPALKPKCVKKDSQVLIIGDSFINWISHSFPEQIQTATGQNWRMLAVGATSMGSGGVGRIPDQFDQAMKADPDAHTIVMDGGGNDVLVADATLDLFGECRDTGAAMKPNCQKIVKIAIDAASAMLDRATTAGIRDVVYFFYPEIPEGRLIGGPHPLEILRYALPMVKDFCDGVEGRTKGKTRCHFIDMIPVFKGHTPGVGGVVAGSTEDWYNEDIHPNSKGSQAEVDAVWKLMKERCIGQKNQSCCES